MTEYFNKTTEKEKRRLLRRNMPEPEKAMWSRLRRNQVLGHNFRRQYSVGAYVIDFYCPALKLAVEIDGDTHFGEEARSNDRIRQSFIESFGIRFLRFTNDEVGINLDGVLETIRLVAQAADPVTLQRRAGTHDCPAAYRRRR